jgi:hypothetical protein
MDIDATGPDGNAHVIIGYVKHALDFAGRMDEWDAVVVEMTSGDYDNLCDVAERVTKGSVKVVNR